MKEIAQEIIDFKIDDSTTIGEINEKFFSLMKKHDISWGDKNDSGHLGANPDYVMAMNHFVESIKRQLEWAMLFEGAGKVDGVD